MFTSFPTQDHYVVYMYSGIIFQILPPCSRSMMSYHVTCHVTVVSCASSSSKRKIKEKKNKIVSIQISHNSIPLLRFHFQRNFFFVPPDPLTHLLIPFVLLQTFFQLFYIFLLFFFPLILLPIPIPL